MWYDFVENDMIYSTQDLKKYFIVNLYHFVYDLF